MVANVIDFESIVSPDRLARHIAFKWVEWNNLRQQWVNDKRELRNYLYATDTTTTSNAILPWSNSTTTPKLTQIADNLHANYFATLFPSRQWMRWEASERTAAMEAKRRRILNYMLTKTRRSGFIDTCSELLSDWIQYGNCFAEVEYVNKVSLFQDGTFVTNYSGPKLKRLSPFDVVFNPAASSFYDSPKIIRTMKTLGDMRKEMMESPSASHYEAIFDRMRSVRASVTGFDGEFNKTEGYLVDGFSDIKQYYGSDYVEILTFHGDFYDKDKDELHVNRKITIVDRAHVLSDEENPSFLGIAPIFHAGWRKRPDNLYAMGPLDNLVGMQYRIDHLENLKADVFDQIAYPILKIRGDVEEFEFAPGARVYMGDEGDVGYLSPDTTALQADLQIQLLEQKMEEMAGAPKQAMGIRTPGEKTAFEVQTLQNSASRIFEHKTAHFERTFIEPILNCMLEVGRRNLQLGETIEVLDKDLNVTTYETITREDIAGEGRIIPIGARHFAERARRVQNLVQLNAVKAGDPSIAPHISGKRMAEIMALELGEEDLYETNVAVKEQMETQNLAMDLQADQQERLATAAEIGA